MPNFEEYYRACLLSRVVDWLCNAERKDWVAMENGLLGVPFLSVLWAPHKSHRTLLRDPPLIALTVSLFQRLCGMGKLSTRFSSLTLLWHNDHFPPRMQKNYLKAWDMDNAPMIQHCVADLLVVTHSGYYAVGISTN